MSIGILGGTFNPPHYGHLIVAESARDSLKLSRILFIPTATSPHKGVLSHAPARDRLEMTRLAVRGNSSFEVSGAETDRGGLSYTVDTVKQVCSAYPRERVQLLIGADNLFDFEEWKSPGEILNHADLVVMTRPGYDLRTSRSEFLARASVVTVPQIGISGTDIRRRVKFGKSIRYLIPPEVEDYIHRHHLYK